MREMGVADAGPILGPEMLGLTAQREEKSEMLKTRWHLILVFVLTAALFAGCSDDSTTTAPEDATLTPAEQFTAMADAAIAYINGSAPSTVTATTLHDNIEDYTVLDIRSQTDYDAGHIEGAIWTSLGALMGDIASKSFPTDKPIVVACYTGQTAGHAVVALRTLGHEAHILKFGMAAWSTTLAAKWTTNCGDGLPAGNIETTDNPLTTEYDWPSWDTDATTGGEVLDARVSSMLAGGFKGITVAEMLSEGLDSYFIINYFGEDDYLGNGTAGVPGHIEGAYQFTPSASLGMDQQLKYLPTDMPIVVYCWTGQTGSQVAAYLNLLGYEAYDLKFSSNALWYSSLTGHKWSEATQSNDYALVTD